MKSAVLGIVKLDRRRSMRALIGAGDIVTDPPPNQVSPGVGLGIVAGVGLLGLLLVLGVTAGAVWLLYKGAKAIFK